MKDFKRLAHAVWQCQYHIVWCPKYRFRILKDEVGGSVCDAIKQLCEWKKVEILEGSVQTISIWCCRFPRRTLFQKWWVS